MTIASSIDQAHGEVDVKNKIIKHTSTNDVIKRLHHRVNGTLEQKTNSSIARNASCDCFGNKLMRYTNMFDNNNNKK